MVAQRLRHSLILASFLLGLASAARGQQGSAIIEGNLWVENGSAERTRIRLENKSGHIVAEAFASVDGQFVFRQVYPDQDYYLVVEKEGYPALRQEVDLRILGNTPHVNLFVRRTAEVRDKRGQNKSVSAAELRMPKKARRLRDRATEQIAQGENEAAIQNLNRVLELVPGFFPAENDLGFAYLNTGRLEEAKRSFESALRHNPEFSPAYVNLGLTLNLLHRYAEAEQALHKGLALNPNSWVGNYQLGQAAFALANYSEAETCLKKALQLNHNPFPQIHLTLGNLYIQTGRYQPAGHEFSEYLKEAPNGAQASRVREILKDMKAKGAVN